MYLFREIPFSCIDLSQAEEAGLVQHRRHTLPRDWPSPVSRFLAPQETRLRAIPHHHRRPGGGGAKALTAA
jgi:hypothetical protein